MKNTQLFLILILFIGFNKIQAQQAALASGGNATGSGGRAGYSIGQIDYITATGSNGSVSQGDRKSTRLNSSHSTLSRMPSSA